MTVEELVKLGASQELAKKVLEAVEHEYVKSGNYIPKAKFDEVIAEKNGLKSQVDQANADLAKLKKDAEGNDALKHTIEDLQKQRKADEAKYAAELLDLKKRAALTSDLNPIAHNPSDILGFVDLAKVSIDDNGAIVGGWDEQKKQLIASKPYMFKATPGAPNPGSTPTVTGSPTPNPDTNPGNGQQGNPGQQSIADFAKDVAKTATSNRFGSDTYFGGGKK